MEDSIRDLQEFVGGGTWHVMDGMEKTCFDLDLKIRSSPYAIHTHRERKQALTFSTTHEKKKEKKKRERDGYGSVHATFHE